MPRANYIRVARVLHWTLAIGLIGETLLGLYGDRMPYAAGGHASRVTLVYALHKTLGVGLMALALVFAVWLQLGRRHPGRVGPVPVAWNVVLARHVYWGLFVGMLVMPLTGPLLHGNGPSWGFAPILWPLKPEIPGVPRSFAAHPAVAAFHAATWWLFTLLSLAHVLLYCKRVDDRRQPEIRPRPTAPAVDARLLRLAPVSGVLMWAALAAISWPTG